jgi:hypothetical protein
MSTQFSTFVNNTYATLATGGHTSGSGSLVLTAGQGAQFGSTFPFRVTVVTAGTYGTTAETLTIFSVTGRSTDTLTVSVVEGSTDRNYAAGDVVEMRWTAGEANLISTAINAIENAPYAVDGLVAHLAGTETIAGAKTFSTLPVLGTLSGLVKAASGVLSAAAAGTDYLTPSGSGASLTGITESQITGLVSDLAAKAVDTSVVHLAGTETITGAKTFSSVPTLPTQSANRIFAGPATGVAAAPSFRALVAADLPIALPVTVANGGTGLATLTAHAVLLGEGTSNVAFAAVGTAGRVLIDQGAAADPAFTAISGDGTLSSAGALAVTKTGGVAFAASATTDTTNAANITSGTLPAARLPNPSATTLGGIQSLAAVASNWINAISTSGVPSATQPAFSDLSGSIAAGQIPAAIITPGMQANATASTLRGNPTGSAATLSDITLGPALSFNVSELRSRTPIWLATSAGTALTASAALTSILAGTTGRGSLTIPANSLVAGSRLTFELFGTWTYASGTPTLYIEFALGGTIIGRGTTGAWGNVATQMWATDMVLSSGYQVQTVGATGTIIGSQRFVGGGQTISLQATGGGNAAPSAVTIDTTISQAITVKMQWSGSGSTYSIQLLGGGIYQDG